MSGRVVDENLEIAPLVTIYDKDTTEIGKADLDGYFEIELPPEKLGLRFKLAVAVC